MTRGVRPCEFAKSPEMDGEGLAKNVKSDQAKRKNTGSGDPTLETYGKRAVVFSGKSQSRTLKRRDRTGGADKRREKREGAGRIWIGE